MLATTQEANEYRQKFYNYYHEKIVKDLARFEGSRQIELQRWTTVMALAGFVIVAGVLLLIYLSHVMPNLWEGGRGSLGNLISYVIFGIAGLLFMYAHRISKNFENSVKSAIMQSFLSFFGDFIWVPSGSIGQWEIDNSKLIGNIDRMDPDDYFEGTHKGLKVTFSEMSLFRQAGRDEAKIFEGLFIKLDMNKAFHSQTILLECCPLNLTFNLSLPTNFSDMEKVSLEDPEFNKMFHVYTQDQIEARYILTTAFMERFKHLQETYKTHHIRASFLNNSVLIAMACNRDLFKLGDLRKPIDDSGEFQNFFEEFIAVLSLVDLLNLDSKTGL